MAVHLAVSLLLDLLHVPAGKRGGAKGDRGQEGDHLPPFFQATQELLSAGRFLLRILQQHAKLVAANPVAVAAGGIGFFDAVRNLRKAHIPL